MPEAPFPIPWSEEYLSRRDRALQSAVADVDLRLRFARGECLPAAFGRGFDERIVEFPWVLAQMPPGEGRVLDAGSTLNHAFLLDQPSLAEKHLDIVTLAPEKDAFWDRGISYIYDDLRALPFQDGLYDVVVSVSTLEHVGCDNRSYTRDSPAAQGSGALDVDSFERAANELGRVLKPGGLLLLTVPFGTYEFHGVFQQFDRAHMSRAKDALGPSLTCSERYYRYSEQGWQISDASDCDDCRYVSWVAEVMRSGKWPEHPSLEPDFAAAARAVACIVAIKSE